jgi:putative ABC transport system ATP-binding protein
VSAIVELRGVSRLYGQPPVHALHDVSFHLAAGELVAIVGPSGSGKSTLLNLLGTLDRPSSGHVTIGGVDVATLDDDDLSALRAYQIGFVFQQFHLTEGVSAVDAVADGLLYTGAPRKERRQRAMEALERVGLAGRATHKPNQLSGGERQRVAIARAVVGNPSLLLADEPTGNLDSVNGAAIVQLLLALNRSGTTIIVITHDAELAARLPRRIAIKDGRLVSDSLNASAGIR